MATRRRIGPVRIPPLAVGTMYFGTQVPTAEALACLDTAFETGARFWDTANNYAFWADGSGDESETVIGRWLTEHGSSAREQVVVATKVGARPTRVGGGLDDVRGLSRSAIRAQVDASLRRLQTDHVDVLYAHIDDRGVPLAETLGALGEVVEEGKARAIAASNLTVDRLREAIAVKTDHRYAAVQQRFTFLVPHGDADLTPHVLLDDRIAHMCMTEGLTMLGYSPLLSGAYTRADRLIPDGYPVNGPALKTLEDVARSRDLDAGQAVLAWMAHRSQPVVPVVGVSRPDHVRSAWEAVGTRLSDEEAAVLDKVRHA